MNSEFFWIIRKRIKALIFNIKKAILIISNHKDKYVYTSTYSILAIKTIFPYLVLGAIVTYLLHKADVSLASYFKSKFIDNEIFKDMVIAGLGISGVILGLYCANISSIFASKYTNAPDNISTAFRRDLVTSKFIKQIVGYIVICIILLGECIFECNIFYVTPIAFLLFTIFVVVAYSLSDSRTYQLSNTYKLADSIYAEITSTLNRLECHSFYSNDQNYQYHFYELCEKRLKLLKDIAIYNKNNPKSQNSAMASFMNNNLALLNIYWKMKSGIYYDSMWYAETSKYKQWHYASDVELDIALKTGTIPQPEKAKSIHWFEDLLLEVNNICFDKLLSENDLINLYSYINICGEMSSIVSSNVENYWVDYISKVKEKLLKSILESIEAGNSPDEETCAGIIDTLSRAYSNIIVDAYRYISTLNVNDALNYAKSKTNFKKIDFKSYPYLNNKICESMYKHIAAEIAIENQIITPDWFIDQTVAYSIYSICGAIICSIETAYEEVFSFGESLQNDKAHLYAAIAYSRIFEMNSKVEKIKLYFDELLPALEKKHFEPSIIWEPVNLKSLINKQSQIRLLLDQHFGECCSEFTLSHWENRYDYPDFLGHCYNHFCEALISSIETNNYDEFKTTYRSFCKLSLLYHEYVRTDVLKIKEPHLQNRVFFVCTAPLMEYAMISGFAILWGEFIGDHRWETLVKDSVASLVSDVIGEREKDVDLLVKIADMVTTRKHSILGIGNRDILHSNWELRITYAILNSNCYKDEPTIFGKRIVSDSKIVQTVCGTSIDSLGIHNIEDLFFIVCINPYLPDDKKYHSQCGWEDQIYEND